MKSQKSKITSKNLKGIIFVFLIAIYYSLFSIHSIAQQGISVNTTGAAADNSAILDVSSTSQGLLIPRMKTTERDAIVSPALSLLIFNITTNCFEAYVNGSWYSVSCAPACLVPAAPTGGASIASLQSIAWNWSTVSGATGYKWNTINNFTTAIDNGSILTYIQTGLACNTSYTIFVWTYNSCGNSSATILQETTSTCLSCGNTFTDARDGQNYKTVQIGTQCWMAQNLNYGNYIAYSSPQSPGGKFCLYDNTSNCTTYGGLYEWLTVMNGSSTCNGNGQGSEACSTPVKGICPSGWHVPSYFEWILLSMTADSNPTGHNGNSAVLSWSLTSSTSTSNWYGTDLGSKLESTSFIHGNNSTGFNVLIAGWAPWASSSENGSYLWTSTAYQDVPGKAWSWFFCNYYQDTFAPVSHEVGIQVWPYTGSGSMAISLRCIHN
jgi:uncharacterized protein (TIGR02145 family)